MTSRVNFSAFVVGMAVLATGFARSNATRAPTFTRPLAISNAFFPFPPNGSYAVISMVDNLGALELSRYLVRTRTIAWNGQSVECRIVEETEIEDGTLLETSENYFAQADDGTVYYFGEIVQMHDPATGNEPSWLVGGPTERTDPADTAVALSPTVFMPAAPALGTTWKPEDIYPIADETATVVGTDQHVATAGGDFPGCLAVQVTTPPNDQRIKYYAPGVGRVFEAWREGWSELVQVRVGR